MCDNVEGNGEVQQLYALEDEKKNAMSNTTVEKKEKD